MGEKRNDYRDQNFFLSGKFWIAVILFAFGWLYFRYCFILVQYKESIASGWELEFLPEEDWAWYHRFSAKLFKKEFAIPVLKASVDLSREANLAQVRNFRDIKELRIRNTEIDYRELKYLARFSKLETLSIDNAGLPKDAFKVVPNLSNLKRLFVDNDKISTNEFERLERFANLEWLVCRPTEGSVTALPFLPKLESLALVDSSICSSVDGDHFFPKLKSLAILPRDPRTDAKPLPLFSTLERLQLGYDAISAEVFESYKQYSELEEFIFRYRFSLKIRDCDLRALGGFDGLKRLTIDSSELRGESIADFPKTLKYLSLRGCKKLSDSSLQPLERFDSLDTLDLSYTPITDESVPFLIETKVQSLNIRGTMISPQGIELIRQNLPTLVAFEHNPDATTD